MSGVTDTAHVLADFSINPMGCEVSTSKYLREAIKIVDESGLNYHTHASGTNIEGKLDEVMIVVRKCIDKTHSMGCPRADTIVKLQTRTDKSKTIRDSMSITKSRI
ncbi:10646_t:CDS:2 [Paraglomus brasilianum]|uniref:10646_t:CDS:1 n=1 Tax=Paraglomus brasilianum TaxID=144538 RepID=A0A9N9F7N1_9GLOM|nr:10646_t:CDS:2 [Paraglomus brasilianum]